MGFFSSFSRKSANTGINSDASRSGQFRRSQERRNARHVTASMIDRASRLEISE